MHKWYLTIAATAAVVGLGAGASVAGAAWSGPSVSVAGAVAAPATYSLSALQALPQTTFSVTRRTWRGSRTETDQGVSLESLVDSSSPNLPDAKNALLRVIVSVGDRWGKQRTFALGELDTSFGNHPAYLALEKGGVSLREPELVVPGDRNDARSVRDVSQITVAVESPTPTTPPVTGALTIEDGSVTRVLSPTELASLPAETLTVTFLAGTASETNTETGPTLDEVLRGYVATVTPAEAWVGGRPLLISLVENGQPFVSETPTGEGPRLVTDGDVKGGRYDSGMDDLVVGDTEPPGPPWW